MLDIRCRLFCQELISVCVDDLSFPVDHDAVVVRIQQAQEPYVGQIAVRMAAQVAEYHVVEDHGDPLELVDVLGINMVSALCEEGQAAGAQE